MAIPCEALNIRGGPAPLVFLLLDVQLNIHSSSNLA